MSRVAKRPTTLARSLAAVATVACSGCGPKTASSEPAAEPARETAARATVALGTTRAGLVARYSLAGPVRQVRFAQTGNVRRDDWRVTTTGLKLEADAVVGTSPFDRFELVLPPDSRHYDRVYPSVTRVGDGFVLFGPGIFLADLDIETNLDPGAGGSVIPERDPLAGYVYLGPSSEVTEERGVRIVGTPSVASWLGDAVRQEVALSMAFYRNTLSAPMADPIVFTTDDMPDTMTFHGDVTDNGVIFLRFAGRLAAQPTPDALPQIAGFVRHESFHLWNGQTRPDSPPWLHEGGAEYAAIVAAVQGGVLSQDAGNQRVGRYLAQCRRELGDAPFSELPAMGSALYDCGVAVQWIADLEARAESSGERHIFSIWNLLLSRGAEDGYGESDFREFTGPRVASFLDAEGGRWAALPARLEPLGVTFSVEPTDEDWRTDLLTQIMAQVCEGGTGWWTENGFVRLDTAERCPSLPEEPEVVAIEQRPLFGHASEAFEAARKRCAAGKPLRLQRREGAGFEVPCGSEPKPSPVLRLQNAPPLSLPSPGSRTNDPQPMQPS